MEINVNTDSQFMQRQIIGQFKVRSESIRPLFVESKALIEQFKSFEITWNPRGHKYTQIADDLVNQCLDDNS